MDQVMILGSSSAVPASGHENTHLFIQAGDRQVLVDCPGSPIVRLEEAGLNPLEITDIILTHFHPDHVSGFAPLLMGLWLMGRKATLNVYGLADTLERAKQMMELYLWRTWPGFYPVIFQVIPEEELFVAVDTPDLRLLTSPVEHLIPTIGLRAEFKQGVVVYSCDTEPSPVVVRLAQSADILIHEATGESVGHTSPRQAGQVAQDAGAKMLVLIHYPSNGKDVEELVQAARQSFGGKVLPASDYQQVWPDHL